jgi:hypothetical protein
VKRYIYIIFLFLIFYNAVLACQCPVTVLNEQELKKYDIIFKGSIKTINLKGEKSEAIFLVSELYKGMLPAEFKIFFNDADACKIDMRVGDEWIIYTNYYQMENAKLDFCSRSRKYIKNSKEDFFVELTGVSYDDELSYLQKNLGIHKLMKENPNKVEQRNILPNQKQFVLLLVCSLIFMVLFLWLFNRYFKF